MRIDGRTAVPWRVLLATVLAAAGAVMQLPPATANGPASTGPATTLSRQYVAAVVARLDVMPSVAYTKYRRDIPVDDPVREAAAERAFVEAARTRGIPAPLARTVILAQFTAAKQVQRRLIRQWSDGERRVPTRQPADLATRLRPRIDAATESLLTALARYSAERPLPGWRPTLRRAAERADRTLRSALSPRDLRAALEGVTRHRPMSVQ